MSYMAILRYGSKQERNIAVFGQTPQICGARLFDQLLSWHGDEHWPVDSSSCRLFRITKTAPGMESRDEILGPEKNKALSTLRTGLAG
jgi:hypothetical protein